MSDPSAAAVAAPPIPVADEVSAPFWEAAQRGELVVHRCRGCGYLSYPPRLVCPQCLLDPPAFEWVPVSGRGSLVTWTIVRDAFLPGFAPLVPYAVGDVRLAEQDDLRIVARLTDVDPGDLRIGLPLVVDFADGGEGTKVPIFRRSPATQAGAPDGSAGAPPSSPLEPGDARRGSLNSGSPS